MYFSIPEFLHFVGFSLSFMYLFHVQSVHHREHDVHFIQ